LLVAVKQVAALDEDFEIRSDGKDVDPDFLIRDLNEWDDYSLEEAVRIKEAAAAGAGAAVEVVVVCIGPEDADESLRKCLAKSAVFRRELEGGVLHEMQIECPAVLTIQLGINTPRYASLRSIKQAAAKPIEAVSLAQLGVKPSDVGESGSLSRVRRMYVPDK